MNEVTINFDVFGALVKSRVFGYVKNCLTITRQMLAYGISLKRLEEVLTILAHLLLLPWHDT